MSANEDNDTGSAQNTRGVTTGKNLKSKNVDNLHIEFNELGQPTGLNRGRFASDMGVLARNIKITYKNWKSVPPGEKETIWGDAKRTWKLDNDKKKIVLKILSRAFREFKSRLTRIYITKTMKLKEGVVVKGTPVDAYQQITKEVWEEFKKQRMDKSFLERSAKARASQRKNEHPHYMGRAGYAGMKEKWYKEELVKELAREDLSDHDPDPTLTQESTSLVNNRLNDRGYLWIKAHTPSSSTPPPQTLKVIENIKYWQTMEQQGDFVPTRLEDVLVKAIGKPEHAGRTRGVGSYVGLQSYFGKPTSRCGRIYTEEDMRLLIEKVKRETMEEVKRETMDEINVMMEKKWAEMTALMPTQIGNGNTDGMFKESLQCRQVVSSCHSTPVDPFVQLKEPVPCRLAVLLNEELIVVAEGMVLPWVEGSMVHHTPLTVENAHVCIDNVIRTDVRLPLPWDGFTTVGDAAGSFARWPKSLIILEEIETTIGKAKRKNKSKDTRESASKLPKKAKSIELATGKGQSQGDEEEDRRLLSMEECAKLGHNCRSLEEKLCSLSKDDTIKMMIDKSVYNYIDEEDGTQSIVSYLTVVEIRQMLRNQWLNIVTLQIWGSFLYQYATQMKTTKEVGYMCPVKLSEYMRNPPQCEHYIAHVLKKEEKKKFIMGPFFEGNHWMLIVACLGLNTVYILDSQQKTKKNFHIKGRLNGAWVLHCIHGGRRNFAKPAKLEIKDKVKCPQQLERFECGYYVMKWMYNITFYYATGKEEDFEKFIADSTLTMDDINEMKEMWANKCLENM